MLAEETKRKLSEVMALYALEPRLRDIYVEGITDKLLFKRFLEKNKVNDFKVIEIDHINFGEIIEEKPHLKRNNKAKLMELAEQLHQKSEGKVNSVLCIADKDFDEILDKLITSNDYLVYTDFNSLELYLFNENCIQIFYDNMARGFSVSAKETLQKITPILKSIFLIRLSLKVHDVGGDNFVDFTKTLILNRQKHLLTFDEAKHLRKVIQKSGHAQEIIAWEQTIVEYNALCTGDARNYIRGHDFMKIFHFFVSKLKSKIGFTEDTLERSFFQCIDFSELHQYPLFQLLITKYKK